MDLASQQPTSVNVLQYICTAVYMSVAHFTVYMYVAHFTVCVFHRNHALPAPQIAIIQLSFIWHRCAVAINQPISHPFVISITSTPQLIQGISQHSESGSKLSTYKHNYSRELQTYISV